MRIKEIHLSVPSTMPHIADDLNLLAPTLSGLKILIDVCEKYANEFYGSKICLLLFKGRN